MAKKYIGENSLRQLWTNIENKIEAETSGYMTASEIATYVSENAGGDSESLFEDLYTSTESYTAQVMVEDPSRWAEMIESEVDFKKANVELYLTSDNIPSECWDILASDYHRYDPRPKVILNTTYLGWPLPDKLVFAETSEDFEDKTGLYPCFDTIGLYVNTSSDDWNTVARVLTSADIPLTELDSENGIYGLSYMTYSVGGQDIVTTQNFSYYYNNNSLLGNTRFLTAENLSETSIWQNLEQSVSNMENLIYEMSNVQLSIQDIYDILSRNGLS